MRYRLVDPVRVMQILPELGLGELLNKNKITLPPVTAETPGVRGKPTIGLARDKVKATAGDIKDLLAIFGGKLPESDRGGLVHVMERKLEEINSLVEEPGVAYSPAGNPAAVSYATSAMTMVSGRPITHVEPEQETDFFLNQLRSDVGYLFLDRTRIRPKGFAIGEHVYTLSLAPGEEIVLEQKTFTKRQMTLEEQTETERQFDLELSSTLSTELQEGMERQKNVSDSAGLSLSHTGQYSSPQFYWGQINASHTIAFTRNTSEASQETARRSLKDSQTTSSKVAAKYRTLHKTTFKISTEEGFESTSKRVIKNPNKYTPIKLHYFKILRVLGMFQERYGIRLCWTPSVKDPAFSFFEQLRKGKEQIIQQALAGLRNKPQEPQPPTPPNQPPEEKTWSWSPEIEADKWSGIGIVAMRAEYQLVVPVDSNHYWEQHSA